jgi:hypothetical protein
MSADSLPAFSENDIANLKAVIRLVVKFKEYLEETLSIETSKYDIEYLIGSIFSGVDIFVLVEHSYRSLIGATESVQRWLTPDFESFRERYLLKYADFASETVFEPKCRMLFDLFKMQIVFAGVYYP